MLKDADPVHKVSIIPRGMALGVTQQLPQDDRHMYTKEYMEAMLAVLMGGRCAEEVIYGRLTTGAGNDIERASNIARNMVCSCGMSEKMGPLAFGKKEEQIFLGKEIGHAKDYSENTAEMIDEEVKRLVMGGYNTSMDILKSNIGLLHAVSRLLLEKETIDGKQIDKLIDQINSGEIDPEMLKPIVEKKIEPVADKDIGEVIEIETV
jgi:cell division protease FtsH